MNAAAVGLLLGLAVLLAGDGAPAPGAGRGWWSARPVWRRRPWRRRPPPATSDVPLLLELVAAAVEAGLPVDRALDRAVRAAPGVPDADLLRVAARSSWADPATAWEDVDVRWRPLAEPLLLSARTGAPAAALLRSAAQQARTDRRRAAEEAAAKLGALLVLPLGLCTLPSFLLLGVVPVVLTLAGDLLAASG